MIVAIITARKGSKRLKNKNIRIIKKMPLYAWAIKILKKTNIFDKIIVSTDHPDILKNAKKYGADLTLIRKKNLADSKSTTIEVIQNEINELIKKKINLKYICCMYPASLLLDDVDIVRSLKFLKKNKKSFIFPVYNLKNKKILINHYNKFVKIKSVLRKKIINNNYIDAGQFYFSSKKTWLSNKVIIKKGNYVLVKKNSEIIDVNTIQDFNFMKRKFLKNYEIL